MHTAILLSLLFADLATCNLPHKSRKRRLHKRPKDLSHTSLALQDHEPIITRPQSSPSQPSNSTSSSSSRSTSTSTSMQDVSTMSTFEVFDHHHHEDNHEEDSDEEEISCDIKLAHPRQRLVHHRSFEALKKLAPKKLRERDIKDIECWWKV